MQMPGTEFVGVVKVGGSLYDLPDFRHRLTSFLGMIPEDRIVLIPGGGSMANTVRDWDRIHQLGEEVSHWLALRTLQVNAQLLKHFLPDASIISSLTPLPSRINILDGYAFAEQDESSRDHLPHTWDVTTDAIAARIARLLKADRLILLKSVEYPRGKGWSQVVRMGLVDTTFPKLIKKLHIEWVNLRSLELPELL
jgi:5-(aminomethyl)-3-furanmethanol phosphate kinase